MSDDEMEVARGAILARGEVVGILHVQPAHQQTLADVLKGAGYHMQDAVPAEDGSISVAQECDIEDPRPCEVNITLARIEELAKTAGGGTGAITALETQGTFTETEALEAINRTIAGMGAGDAKDEAEMWREAAFGEEEA